MVTGSEEYLGRYQRSGHEMLMGVPSAIARIKVVDLDLFFHFLSCTSPF